MFRTAETERQTDETATDLPGTFRAVVRRLPAALATGLLFGGLAFGALSLVPPRFEAETRILVDHSSAPKSDGWVMASHLQLLTSQDLARRVADRLHLEESSEFDGTDLSVPEKVMIATGLAGDPLRISAAERIVDTFGERLDVRVEKDTRLISVRFQSRNRELAAAVANVLVEEYLLLRRQALPSATGQAGSLGVDARLVQRAAVPELPAFPRTGILTVVAAVAGMLLATAGVIAADWLSGRARGGRAEPERSPRPVAPNQAPGPSADHRTVRPIGRSHANLNVLEFAFRVSPRSPRSPGLSSAPTGAGQDGTDRSNVSQIRAMLIGDGSVRIAMASVGVTDELDRVVADFSRQAVAEGSRVVVIDAVPGRPGKEVGLADLLAGRADFAEIIRRNPATRAHEIAFGRDRSDGRDVDDAAIDGVLATLEHTYDMVVLDLGPLGEADRFRLRLVAGADHVVLVGRLDDEDVGRAAEALRASGVTSLSTLEIVDGPAVEAA